jgi:hypothetical protein
MNDSQKDRAWRLLARAIGITVVLFAVAPAFSALAAHDEFRFVGTVVRLELARNRFSMKFKEADGREETVQVAFTAKTEVTRDKKSVARAELKPGVHVVVDALGDDYDNLEAVAVRIVPPPR